MLTASTIKRTFASAVCAAAIVAGTAVPAFAANKTVQCEDMNISGPYVNKYVQSGQFGGVTFFANDDSVSFNQDFSYDTHDFKLRGRSTTDAQGQVDLYIGGDFMGSFFYKGGGTWEAPLTNIARTQHKTGNQQVKLVCVNDNGTWDLELDYFVIENARNQNGNNGNQNQNWNNGNQNQNWNNNQGQQNYSDAVRTVQAEEMNTTGQYARKINNPLNGVILCQDEDAASFWNNFANDTHDITICGRSDNDNCCKVDLLIGDQYVTSFYWKGTYNTECTIQGLHHLTGNREVKLVCKGDNGTWDAMIDYVRIENGRNEGKTSGNVNNVVLYNGQPADNNGNQNQNQNWNNNQNQNWNNNQGQNWNNNQQPANNGNNNQKPANNGNNNQQPANNQPVNNGEVIECEKMTIEGEYAAETSPNAYWEPAPFAGVKLCAPGDGVSFKYNFDSANNGFALRGQSTTDARAEVAMYIDGQFAGTFYFPGKEVVEAKLENIYANVQKTGTHTITLSAINETGKWDVNIDYLKVFKGQGAKNNESAQPQQNNNGQQNVQPQQQDNNGQQNVQPQQQDNNDQQNVIKWQQPNNDQPNFQPVQQNNGGQQGGDIQLENNAGDYVNELA